MNTLITGGGGLLGKEISFGMKPSKQELNLLDYDSLKKYIIDNNITQIVHAAGRVGGVKANSVYICDFFTDNLQMNLNVIKACKEFRLNNSTFFLSTCVFPQDAPLPLKESYIHAGEPHHTNFGYAYAKRMLEVGARCLQSQYGVSARCIVPCNMYGKNDNYHIENGHVLPSLIHKCYIAKMTNQEFNVWGSGKAEREFLYVDDLSRILDLIYLKNVNIEDSLMIVSDGNFYTIEEIVYHIIRSIGFSGKVIFDKTKPEGIMRKNTDNSLFRKYFANFNFTKIDDGINQTVEYFLKNYNNVRK